MASTNAAGSNGARSSGPSPKTLAWRRPFCPVVASRTSSTSSTVACRAITRLILPSSSISPVLVCSLPAVSTMTVSTPRPMPSLTASKATLAGSAPSRSARTVRAPTRVPQVSSWSAAAARNVSAAPSSTVRPSPTSTRASLPQVVVFPVPLTPTTSSTAGRSPWRAACSDRSWSGPIAVISWALSSARTSSAPRLPVTLTSVRSRSTSSRAGVTPISAVISVSSISSQVWSSRPSRASRVSRTEPNADCDLASRPRSRTSRPADGGGAGSAGALAGSATVSTPGGAVAVPVASWVAGPARRAGPGRSRCGPGGGPPRRVRTSNRLPVMAATMTRAMMRIRMFMTAPVWQTLAMARSGALAFPQPLADHGGDAVAAHADAVQRVVERCLDLVQDIERRGPGLEDRDQEGDRGQRPLAAGQQRQPLNLLARRPGLEVDTGAEHVVRLGQHEPAIPAGEQCVEDALELPRGVLVSGGEHLLHPVVDLLDHGQQVTAGLPEVLELGDEEGVPLFERRELLKGERVHLAELIEQALGGLRTALLGRPVVWQPRLALVSLRYADAGTVLGGQRLGVYRELIGRAGRDLLKPHPAGGSGDLRAVRAVHHLVEFTGQLADLSPDLLQLVIAPSAGLLGGLPVRVSRRTRLLDPGHGEAGPGRHRTGQRGLPFAPDAPGRGPLPGLALGAGRSGQRIRAPGDGPQAFFAGPDVKPGVHLGIPRGHRQLSEPVAVRAGLADGGGGRGLRCPGRVGRCLRGGQHAG